MGLTKLSVTKGKDEIAVPCSEHRFHRIVLSALAEILLDMLTIASSLFLFSFHFPLGYAQCAGLAVQ